MLDEQLIGRDLDEALALAMGYEYVDAPAQLKDAGILGKLWHSPDGIWRLDGLPLFHRGLNEMHIVESEIERRGLVDDYVRELVQIAAADKNVLSDLRWLTIHATAGQKARAAIAAECERRGSGTSTGCSRASNSMTMVRLSDWK